MNIKLWLALVCLSILSCSNNGEVEQKSALQENRVFVVEGEKSSVSIIIPDDWEVIDYEDQWVAAKDSCENEFCANIVYYNAQMQNNDISSLIEDIVSEIRNVYESNNYKLLFKSPISEYPTQFSMGYTLREGNLNLLGYTFVIENNGDVHAFEMLDMYLDDNEIQEKLIASAELLSTIVVENH